MEGKCLQCKQTRALCKCEGGFKVLYYLGKAVSKKELEELPTYGQAMENAEKEINKINRLYGRG